MIPSMAIEAFDRGKDGLEIRGLKAIVKLKQNEDGTWTMGEGADKRTFPDRGSAFDAAKEIAGEF